MRKLRALLVVVLLLLLSADLRTQQPPLRIHFFDVGQGDAVLIQSPAGQNVLYDGGDSPSKILARLAAVGVSRIDLVVASHNHADHIGGLADVITQFRPRFYLDNGVPATTLTYRRVLAAVQTAGTQLLEPSRRRIVLGENASLDVLPPPGIPGWDQNDNAVGLVLAFGAFRLSLAGDAERREWMWWIQNHPDLVGRVQVHKASHHGSNNGDIAAALSALAPEVVIISVGQNNTYGHPHPEALRLYTEQRSAILRTDVHGTVVVEAEPTGQYHVRVERGEGAKPPPPLIPARAPR